MMTFLICWLALSAVGTLIAVAMIRTGKRREAQSLAYARARVERAPRPRR